MHESLHLFHALLIEASVISHINALKATYGPYILWNRM